MTSNELPKVDMCIDVAVYLNSLLLGVFNPFGVTGDIFVEFAPTDPLVKTCLYQQGGGGRELKYRGDIRRPILHIEHTNTTRLKAKEKLTVIANALDQVNFYTPYSSYFFRLQSEPIVWKVSDSEFKGSINLDVTHTVINNPI